MLSTNTFELLTVLIAAIFCVHQVSSQPYIASNGPFNPWSDAQAWCVNNQSHLVEIKNDVDLGNVAQFIQSSTLRGYIALNAQLSNDGSWRWISGTAMDSWIAVDNQAPAPTYTNYVNINRKLTSSDGLKFTAELPTSRKGFICQYADTSVIYSNWASGHPSNSNQQCLSMFYTSPSAMVWYTVACQSPMAAICEKNQSTTPSPVTTASPTSSMQPTSSPSSNSGTTTNTMPSTSTTADDTSTKQTNLALALGVGIGGGVGLIIIIILVVVAAILCTRRRRERKPEDTRPIEENGPIYAQVIPSKDASESVESSPGNGGKELIYVELPSTEEFRPNSTRQTMHPPDILPESFKQRQASVVIADNGDIYSVPHKKSSTSGDGGSSACLTSTTSI